MKVNEASQSQRLVWTPDEFVLDDVLKAETPAWQREEGKNPKGGLNAAGRASYNRETGGNLKPPVRSGDNPRRASFLARMGNNAGPERDENGEPTRLLLSLQAWGADSKADARAKAKAISARNANKVDKGDFVGHPFRGNQWTDASGASTTGASEASEVNSDRNIRLRTTADNINDKLEVLREAGATIKINRNGLDYADREAYTSQLPMVSLAEPNAQLIANGAAMTEEALNDDGSIVVIEDKDGRIAGAMSMSRSLDKAARLDARLREAVSPNTMWLEMRSAGSTMSVDGVGSALLAAAIVRASEEDAGLYLVPLNVTAQKFWEAKGFVTVQQKGFRSDETTYQYLDAKSVKAIADDLDEEFE
jgi:hypothetical protein